MIHVLKCEEPFFDAIESGQKNFEIRYNDRGFQSGDTLELWRTKAGLRTGRRGAPLVRAVTYVLSGWGLRENFVALGLGFRADEGTYDLACPLCATATTFSYPQVGTAKQWACGACKNSVVQLYSPSNMQKGNDA